MIFYEYRTYYQIIIKKDCERAYVFLIKAITTQPRSKKPITKNINTRQLI